MQADHSAFQLIAAISIGEATLRALSILKLIYANLIKNVKIHIWIIGVVCGKSKDE